MAKQAVKEEDLLTKIFRVNLSGGGGSKVVREAANKVAQGNPLTAVDKAALASLIEGAMSDTRQFSSVEIAGMNNLIDKLTE